MGSYRASRIDALKRKGQTSLAPYREYLNSNRRETQKNSRPDVWETKVIQAAQLGTKIK